MGVDVEGKVALDSGLSTGGFTDCLLQYGASFVYGVDVGYGQVIKLSCMFFNPTICQRIVRSAVSYLHEFVPFLL